MEYISRVEFEPRRLLNRSEYGILRILEKVVRETGGGRRVMAQTSLGEVIGTRSASGTEEARDLAFRSINSKRLDFLVIDRSGIPVLAVEYQGHGHYQNNAFMRDAVKREAVRKGGSGSWRSPRSTTKRFWRTSFARNCGRVRRHRLWKRLLMDPSGMTPIDAACTSPQTLPEA